MRTSPSRRRTLTPTSSPWRTRSKSTDAPATSRLWRRSSPTKAGSRGLEKVSWRRRGADLQPEACLEQQEHRGRRPRLRGAGHRVEDRRLRPPAGRSRRTTPAYGAGRSTALPRTARPKSGSTASPDRSVPGRGRPGHCRAARRRRCDTTSGCSAAAEDASVRTPQPENDSGPSSVRATRRARSAAAMPLNRHLPRRRTAPPGRAACPRREPGA